MLYQFSGVNTLTFYAVEIFKDTGTGMNKYLATVILGVVRLLATIAACIALRRCGRRPLTMISGKTLKTFPKKKLRNLGSPPTAFWFPEFARIVYFPGVGCGVTMVGLGTYMYYANQWKAAGEEIQYTWIPLACIFIFTITCCLGFLVVPWVMIGELYPVQVYPLKI